MPFAPRVIVGLCLWASALPALAQQLTVTDVSPAPGSETSASPASISIVLSDDVDASAVTPSTFTLVEAGLDAVFNTADDVAIAPNSTSVNGATVTLDLAGITLPFGSYRIRISGTGVAPATVGDLFAYWKLNEGAGTSAADSTLNGRTGTLDGPVWTTGLFGSALSFGGGVPRVDIDAGVVEPDWTVTMWVHRSADVVGTAATLLDSNSIYGTSLRMEQVNVGNQVGITEYTTIDYGFGVVAPVGRWVHLAFSSTASNARLHVNGVLVDTSPRGFNLHLDKLGSARANVSESLNGVLSEVQVYSRVLSDAEIAGLAAITGAVKDSTGGVLDGEYSGGFPSGNGVGGGDFESTFAIVPTAPEDDGGGGSCGALGIEFLALPGMILLLKRARSRKVAGRA